MKKRKHRLTRRGNRVWVYWPKASEYLSPGWTVWVSQHGWIAWKSSRTGYVGSCYCGSWHGSSREEQIEELRTTLEEIVKRRTSGLESSRLIPHADYADLLETMPSFAAWMTDATFEDGTHRQGGWVSIYARAGSWCATLKDSAEGLQITVTAPSWSQLLILIEHAIIDPQAPWRPDTGPKPKTRK